MGYEFVVENYNHPHLHDVVDINLHISEISGTVHANTLAQIDVEGIKYKFEIIYVEKDRKLKDSLSSNDKYGCIGAKFITPEEHFHPWNATVWVKIFSGRKVKCLSL